MNSNPGAAALNERLRRLSQTYAVSRRRKVVSLGVAAAALLLLLLTGLSVGGASFDIARSWRALVSGFGLGRGEMALDQQIIWNLRVPRVFMAIVSGMALAAAGLVMQTILRNPLASPYTLGISSASSFGAALSIVCGFSAGRFLPFSIPSNYIVAFNAFLCALACTLTIYLLSRTRRVTAETIVLFGVAVNFLFSAATSFLQYISSEEKLAELVYWMFGSLSKATWSKFYMALGASALAILLIYIKAWDFNALMMGDETAGSLGVRVERVRLYGLVLSSFITAVVVSLLGPIGFIGLVGPHIGRMLIGTDQRYLIPLSCLIGADLLLAADIVGNVILAPQVLPVGIVTSFVGVPLLICLVTRKKASYW